MLTTSNITRGFSAPTTALIKGGSPGLMVMGDDRF